MFTVTKEMHDKIAKVCKIAPSKSAINQALTNVLITASDGVLTVGASDSMIEMTSKINCDVEVNISTCVDASKFISALKACGAKATVQLKDDLIIKNGRRKFNLKTIDPENYPSFPQINDSNLIDIKAEELIQSIKRVSFASAKNDVRYCLNGVNVSNYCVGTDGHRIAMTELGLEDVNIILPQEVIGKLDGLTGDVYVCDGFATFKSDDTVFNAKLIDGKYPDVSTLMNEQGQDVSIDRVEFIDAIKACSITSHSDLKSVMIKFDQGVSTIESISEKRESSTIGFNCEMSEADPIEFGVNSSYLIDALNVLESEIVAINVTDSKIIINQDGISQVIMKVKL